jgi:hypothetical protein
MIVGFSYNGVYSQPSEIKRLHVNRPPVVDRKIEDFVLVLGEERSFDLGEYISDPDGDELQYSVTSNSPLAVARPDVSGSRLTVSAIGRGFTEFVVIGSDADGRSVWFEFQVYVYDPSNPVDFVSTTVSDKLVVRTAQLMDTRIRISGQTGKVMFDKTMQVGAFQPATIDVSAFPPGVYKVAVTMEGKTYDNRIVKI